MSALVWYVGQRDPSLTETLTVDGVAFDLTSSTVRFKMRAANSSTLKVDASATIVTAAAGEVRYDWAALDVDTAGDYLAWWEVTTGGKKQDQGEFWLEIRPHAPSSRALCTRADVTRLVPGYSDDQNTDGVLEALIEAESQAVINRYGREFVGIDLGASETRQFDLDERQERNRTVKVGDMTTVTAVVIKDVDGTTLETVSSSDRVSLPRKRQAWEPITELWFPGTTNAASYLSAGNVLHVTGIWGFPEIPDDVRMAVAKLVLVRYLSDAANAGTALADSLVQQGFDAGIAFVSAREVLSDYQATRFD